MRRGMIAGASVLSVSVAGLGLSSLFAVRTPPETEEDYGRWSPTQAAIHDAVAVADRQAGGKLPLARREAIFAGMFKDRFRYHTTGIAVGLRFVDHRTIALKLPPRMEPWNMDRVAIEAWRESEAVLGRKYVVDIYLTYIGQPAILIGALRPGAGPAGKATIFYHRPRFGPVG